MLESAAGILGLDDHEQMFANGSDGTRLDSLARGPVV